MRFGLIFSLILAIIAVVFALQNPQVMDVNLLFFETQGSKALILIVTFALGVLVGVLSLLPGRIRARRALRKLKREQKKTDSSDEPTARSASESSSTS
jgi:putative membrane protein